jgi:hypothetical protein
MAYVPPGDRPSEEEQTAKAEQKQAA